MAAAFVVSGATSLFFMWPVGEVPAHGHGERSRCLSSWPSLFQARPRGRAVVPAAGPEAAWVLESRLWLFLATRSLTSLIS